MMERRSSNPMTGDKVQLINGRSGIGRDLEKRGFLLIKSIGRSSSKRNEICSEVFPEVMYSLAA